MSIDKVFAGLILAAFAAFFFYAAGAMWIAAIKGLMALWTTP